MRVIESGGGEEGGGEEEVEEVGSLNIPLAPDVMAFVRHTYLRAFLHVTAYHSVCIVMGRPVCLAQ